jgi:hypothetical protein
MGSKEKQLNNIALFLNKPHTIENQVQKIIQGSLKRRNRDNDFSTPPMVLFSEDFFNLPRVGLYHKASQNIKNQILFLCIRDILNEIYYIEKLGVAYCAKMVLNAQTIEIAQLYSMIGNDEATHLQWITPYINPKDRKHIVNPFFSFIESLVEMSTPNLLYYLVQTILEGWGIRHYKTLSEHCLFPPLKALLQKIIQDEAMHHHTGRVLFNSEELNTEEWELVEKSLIHYAKMIQIGPQAVVSAIETILGKLTLGSKLELFTELDTENHARSRLMLLQDLMMAPGMENLMHKIRDKGFFKPLTAVEAARFHEEYCGSRE